MGTYFTLDDDLRREITAAFDDIITELGKDCKLVYPPKWVTCNNCIFSSLAGGKSTNHWKTGGPIPFQAGASCPMCGGQGKKAQEVSETIRLSCEWSPNQFAKFGLGVSPDAVQTPFSLLMTKGYLVDLPKIKRCDHLIVQIPVQGYYEGKFKLVGEPGDRSNIIQNRYCIAMWQRAG